jgi:hypothetical protein
LVAKLVSYNPFVYPFLSLLGPFFAHILFLLTQFAKHMKVEEQVTLLNSKKIGMAVGTPARLMELIDNGKFSIYLKPLQDFIVQMLTRWQVHYCWTGCSAWSLMPHTLTRRREASWT